MSRVLPALALCAACASPDATPVRTVLSDGQVLVGEVRTDTLFLESALGTLPIPLDDVGEVLPVEGGALDGSGGYVTVWLRNGSELRGRWADPELEMGLVVGGQHHRVDLPVHDLVRFQMQGGELWPNGEVFRVRTHSGDDFLVDPDASRIRLTNELGTFTPFLSECASIAPGPEQWTVVLHTGTALTGRVEGDGLRFELDLGPAEVDVPLDAIASMGWERWAPAPNAAPIASPVSAVSGEFELFEEQAADVEVRYRRARSKDVGGGWFSNQRLYDAKY